MYPHQLTSLNKYFTLMQDVNKKGNGCRRVRGVWDSILYTRFSVNIKNCSERLQTVHLERNKKLESAELA